MSNPTVRDVMGKWLKDNGYDGLVNVDGECGCQLDDLAPCSECHIMTCIAAYRRECDGKCEYPDGCDFHMDTAKPKKEDNNDGKK